MANRFKQIIIENKLIPRKLKVTSNISSLRFYTILIFLLKKKKMEWMFEGGNDVQLHTNVN